jgi:type VI secretion system secreted protein VgrG
MRITDLTTPLGTDPFGDSILKFRQLDGKEGINNLFDYTLTVHSTVSDIAPNTLLGKAVTVSIQDQFGSSRYLNAIVASFKFQGGDQRRTIYEAKLVPWLTLATFSADCRIFQHMTIPDIVTQVLGKYPFPVKQKLIEKYPSIPFAVQYNETDYAFVARLLERAGIGYYFDHTADSHTLVLTDLMSVYTPIAGHESVSFRAPDSIGIADEETVSRWNPQQSIKSGSFTTDDYDYRQPFAHFEQQGGGTAAPKGHIYEDLAIYHWQGQGHYNDRSVGENLVKVRQDQQQQQFQAIDGDCNVRAFVVGASGSIFALEDHPQDEMNQQVLIVATKTFIKENLSTTGAGEHTDWSVTLTVTPEKNQYRPQRLTPLPRVYGPQTAIVVGPSGKEIWTTDLGEVFVRFLWDRYASGDQNSSCPIRVCSTWAGDSWGQNAVPRIGTEVIVNFLDGNPDYPLVVGRVVNSSRPPPSFSNTGSLPGNEALAGIKSRELQGQRYNQVLLDDTKNEIRVQVESEHAKTQLNMGFLVHPRNVSAAARGEGFELRTDAWGALRAANGLFLSADPRLAGSDNALSRDELVAILEQALSLAKSLGDFAAKNLGNESDPKPQEKLSKAVKDWGHGSNAEKGENGGNAILAASAPEGISFGTAKDVTVAAGDHIDLVAQKNLHFSAGDKLNMHAKKGVSQFAVEGGIKSIAHKGKHITQAQTDDIEINADQSVTITASHDHVMIAADKHITLTSGGGYIKIADGNIQIHCPGTIDMKSGNYTLAGPASFSATLPALPQTKFYDEQFVIRDKHTGVPMPYVTYRIETDDGETIHGMTDENGQTERVMSDKSKSVKIYVE